MRNRRARLRQRLEGTIAEEEVPVPVDVAKANVLDEDTGERLTDEEAGQRTERSLYGTTEQIQA